MRNRAPSRRPVWPAIALAAAIAVMGAIALPGFSPSALAQQRGTLSGPTFVESAGVLIRFQQQAGELARERSGREDIRAFASRAAADYEAMITDLRAALGRADGVIKVPDALDAKHETLIERLKTARGTDFDALYVQTQIDALNAAAGVFGAYARDGDQTALKEFADKHASFLKSQLDAARSLEIKT